MGICVSLCRDCYGSPDSGIGIPPVRENVGFGGDNGGLRPFIQQKSVMSELDQHSVEAELERLHREIARLQEELKKQRGLEAQLFQAQKMEALATLSGGIAHDFNNILHCILGYTELLLLERPRKNSDFNSLKQIQAMVNKGRDLAQQLLAFGRKVPARFRALDLNDVVREVVKLLHRTIPKMIEIELLLSDDLQRVRADAGQCEQLIMNLCINAQDAMPDGGKITATTENVSVKDDQENRMGLKPGDYVHLSVADTGRGMEPGTLAKIYEPFFTTKEKGKGTGLGLAIVYGVAKNHEATIDCRSQLGEGTSFHIYFPVTPAAAITATHEPLDLPTGPLEGRELILLIEDEADIVDIGRQVLEEHGYRVITAANGEEGIVRFMQNRRKIDLVLLDISMPGIGGIKCMQQILHSDPDAKIALISGYTSNGRFKEAIRSGARAFLSKPYSRSELLRTVRKILDNP